MGKSYRNVSAMSSSESMYADKSRDFAKNKKAYSHHQIRNDNKNCDEDSIQTTHLKTEMCLNPLSNYYGKIGNIPNASYKTINDVLFTPSYHNIGESKTWDKTDDSLLKSIDRAIINGDGSHEKNKSSYLVATKKQIQRRGEVGAFKGHR